jgi:uncharacterized membrane protein YtjA (UPF0391 family)
MLYSSLVFLVAALVAGLLGFAGPAQSPAARIARVAAVVLLGVAAASALAGKGFAS